MSSRTHKTSDISSCSPPAFRDEAKEKISCTFSGFTYYAPTKTIGFIYVYIIKQ